MPLYSKLFLKSISFVYFWTQFSYSLLLLKVINCKWAEIEMFDITFRNWKTLKQARVKLTQLVSRCLVKVFMLHLNAISHIISSHKIANRIHNQTSKLLEEKVLQPVFTTREFLSLSWVQYWRIVLIHEFSLGMSGYDLQQDGLCLLNLHVMK